MFCKKIKPVILCMFIMSMMFANNALPSEKKGTRLKFTLESKTYTVTVSGKVTDAKTGRPIENALVRGHVVVWLYRGPELFEKCPYQETTTDTEGNYQLQFITPLTTSGPMKDKDSLGVYVSAPGYETRPEYVRAKVAPSNTNYSNFDFELKRGKLIQGKVVDEDGNAVAGAQVRVQNNMNGDWHFFGALGQTFTDQEGYFECWIGKRYLGKSSWLEIIQPEYGSASFLDYLKNDSKTVYTLPRGGDIRGKVVDRKDNGVPNCEVCVRCSRNILIDKTLTDDKGEYFLKGVGGNPSLINFRKAWSKRVGRNPDKAHAKVHVYARMNPAMNLRDVPRYEITAADGQTVAGPDLVVGIDSSVSGKLIASDNTFGLGGLMVRLDGSWDNMVQVDAEGNFYFPYVSAGKHKLTAYLPHNLRYDRGIGQAEVEVKEGESVENIRIRLENLAELRIQYLDADGNPLEGITAGATWSKSGRGGWTEGTRSDKEGWAVLYLYPDSMQHVRGFDSGGNLVAEGFESVAPKPGQLMENLQIVMVPFGSISGQLFNVKNEPFAETTVFCKLGYADGMQKKQRLTTDPDGRFKIGKLSPGIVNVSIEIDSVVFGNVLTKPFELKPAGQQDLGRIVLENGIDRNKTIKDKHTNAIAHSDEIKQAAELFFRKIQTADYEKFLRKNANWRDFPIVGYYQTYKWFDLLVKWICITFKDNPIVTIELGEVFENPELINKERNLPTVPYKLTLEDGTVLEGKLPFVYNFDGDKGHWHGLHGIDWHLKK